MQLSRAFFLSPEKKVTRKAAEIIIAMELADLEIEPFRRDLAVAEEKLSRQPDNAELETIRARLAKEVATLDLISALARRRVPARAVDDGPRR